MHPNANANPERELSLQGEASKCIQMHLNANPERELSFQVEAFSAESEWSELSKDRFDLELVLLLYRNRTEVKSTYIKK